MVLPVGGVPGESAPGPGQPGNMAGERRENCCSSELAAELASCSPAAAAAAGFLAAVVGGSGCATPGLVSPASETRAFLGLGLEKSWDRFLSLLRLEYLHQSGLSTRVT